MRSGTSKEWFSAHAVTFKAWLRAGKRNVGTKPLVLPILKNASRLSSPHKVQHGHLHLLVREAEREGTQTSHKGMFLTHVAPVQMVMPWQSARLSDQAIRDTLSGAGTLKWIG